MVRTGGSSIPSGCIFPASRSDAARIRADVADGLCTAYVSRAILQILTLTLDCAAKRHVQGPGRT